MASAAASRRRGSANNARIAAKQRRQRILVVVLVAALAVILAWEVPKLRARSSGSASAAVAAAPAAAAPRHVSRHVGGTGADPFAPKALSNSDAHAVSGGGPDPFTGSPGSSSSFARPAALPQRIVIGRPGGHRVAKRGWIVILASIPTRNGRSAALSFARGARRSVGGVAVLNSSNRRPLRGGYWVVYKGPYSTLSAVSQRAGNIHAAGYRTAYIRELISYR
jgi:hypothetical protein